MGLSKKSQMDGDLESEGKQWVMARLLARASFPIKTKSRAKHDDGDDKSCSTTPPVKEAKIPEKLSSPPARGSADF